MIYQILREGTDRLCADAAGREDRVLPATYKEGIEHHLDELQKFPAPLKIPNKEFFYERKRG